MSAAPAAPALTVDAVRLTLRNLNNPAVQRVVLNALDTSGGDLERVVGAVAAWYDSAMDRVSGWYKRSTQYVVFGVGLALAVALNVDAVSLARYLARHDAARGAVVAQAARAAGDTLTLRRTYEQTQRDLDALQLPIGWPRAAAGAPAPWYAAVPGWLLTALAATLGAPFWFDVLNKVMVVRSTVRPHEKSPEEASEDRQSPPASPAAAGAPNGAAIWLYTPAPTATGVPARALAGGGGRAEDLPAAAAGGA